jgi:hypothetical protein
MPKKGDVPVKKYKSARRWPRRGRSTTVSLHLAQAQSLGTTWIGYAYIDDLWDEVIYWFPYENDLTTGIHGAIEYIPIA